MLSELGGHSISGPCTSTLLHQGILTALSKKENHARWLTAELVRGSRKLEIQPPSADLRAKNSTYLIRLTKEHGFSLRTTHYTQRLALLR